jgi:hypothetical protein
MVAHEARWLKGRLADCVATVDSHVLTEQTRLRRTQDFQEGICGNDLSQANESPHDRDIRGNRTRTAKHRREHGYALLCERLKRLPTTAPRVMRSQT